jgi:hypothetical protein
MKRTVGMLLLIASLTGFAAAKKPDPADYPEAIKIIGSHLVSVDSGHVSMSCRSTAGYESVNTNCSGREVYTEYTVTTGIDTNSTLRLEMVMLDWAGNMKTASWLGRDIIMPGNYFFRFLDGKTIEVLNGKKKSRFTIISTYCTQDLGAPVNCKAGEQLKH